MMLKTEKTKRLMNLLDTMDLNQIVIFVKTSPRAKELSRILESDGFHNICITGDMPTDMRLDNFKKFKQFEVRILISTGLFGRGIDVERVNVVINYDFPDKADEYLHRVGRAGRFGTKGFISSPENAQIMEQVQLKFAVDVPSLPDTIDSSLYMNWRVC